MEEDFTSAKNTILAVGTSSVVVFPANPRRKGFVISNTSDLATKIITINLGDSAAVSKYGIVLQQNGVYSESTNEGFPCFKGVITAISDVAAGQISIMERT